MRLERLTRSKITPESGPSDPLAFSPIDRSKLAISFASYLAERGRAAEAETQLLTAQDLLAGKGARSALTLADAQMTDAVLKLRRQDFAGATRLLKFAQESSRGRLPVGNPRLALLETYLSIARLGERGAAVSEYDRLAQSVSDKLTNVGPASVKARFTAWLNPSGHRDWTHLPLVQL